MLFRAVADAPTLAATSDALHLRLGADPTDAGALFDIATLVLLTGETEKGLRIQSQALAQQRSYRRAHGTGGGPRLLAFMVAGDLMANIPVDFLLEGSDVELTCIYLDGPPPPFQQLPAHDVALLAIGQSEDNDPLLARLAGVFEAWPRPVLNGRADAIAALTRDGVAARCAGHPRIAAPATRRLPREALTGALDAALAFPILLRPVGSHAGHGLERIDDRAGVETYLAGHGDAEFYASDFHDYAGPDGLYRKYRVVFIDGRPFLGSWRSRRAGWCTTPTPKWDRTPPPALPTAPRKRRPWPASTRALLRGTPRGSPSSPRRSAWTMWGSTAPSWPTGGCCCSRPMSA